MLQIIESGKATRNEIANFCNTARETTKETLQAMTLKLLIEGSLLIKDVGEFCKSAWETTSDFFESVSKSFLESLKNEKENYRLLEMRW